MWWQLARACLVASIVCVASAAQGCVNFTQQGPMGVKDCQVCEGAAHDNVAGADYSGAIQRVAVAGDVAFIGSTNGGVWMTSNYRAQVGGVTRPTWRSVLDQQTSITCFSIGALAIDQTAGNHQQRVVAGCSNPSNYMSFGTVTRSGVLISNDRGATWNMSVLPLASASQTLNIVDVVLPAARVILVAVRSAYVGVYVEQSSTGKGVWRSVDNGISWTQPGKGTPFSNTGTDTTFALFSMVNDRNVPAFVVATGTQGVFTSVDSGLTWTLRTTGLGELTGVTNAVVAISNPTGTARVLYVGFFRPVDECNGIGCYSFYFSTNDGLSFLPLPEPFTIEAEAETGLGPQGDPNFCLLADPADPTIVYVGGTGIPGTSLGNMNQVARLFRGKRSGTTITWSALTGKTQAALGGQAIVGVGGTTSNSAPHTDTRHLAWDYKNGWLINANDGGVYYRTTPRLNAGDWFPMNGNLAIQELVSATYEPTTGTIIGGSQDNANFITDPSAGNAAILAGNGLVGRGVVGGDGGYSWVDTSSSPAKFFVTSQFLTLSYLTVASFATQQHAAQVDWTDTLLGGGDINPFHPYIAGNAVTSSRMMVCVTSPTQGCFGLAVATGGKPTVTTLLADVFLDAYAFGGVASGVANAEVAFGISVQPATVVYRRTTAGTSSFAQISSTGLPASFSLCAPILALNPTNYNEVLLTGIPGTPMATSQVYLSSNFGSSFTSISGNLFAISGAAYDFNGQCTLIVNLAGGERAYLVGTFQGVFVAYSSVPSLWKRLGEKAEFPSVIVTQMRHYPATDLLLVATMGRSVWTIGGATGAAGASAILAALKTNACPAPKTLRPVFCAPGTMLVSSACVSCVADTYSATIDAATCAQCPRGTISTGGASACTPFPVTALALPSSLTVSLNATRIAYFSVALLPPTCAISVSIFNVSGSVSLFVSPNTTYPLSDVCTSGGVGGDGLCLSAVGVTAASLPATLTLRNIKYSRLYMSVQANATSDAVFSLSVQVLPCPISLWSQTTATLAASQYAFFTLNSSSSVSPSLCSVLLTAAPNVGALDALFVSTSIASPTVSACAASSPPACVVATSSSGVLSATLSAANLTSLNNSRVYVGVLSASAGAVNSFQLTAQAPPCSTAAALAPHVSATVQFKISGDVTMLQALIPQITGACALALNVSFARISVVSMVAGSAIVTIGIAPDTSTANSETPTSLVAALAAQASSSTSTLAALLAPIVGSIDTSYVPLTATGPLVYQCADGSWQTTMLCASCPAGSYLNGATCLPCAPGSFTAASNSAGSCAPCALGTYASASGATACTACAAGMAGAVLGSSSPNVCVTCAEGTFSGASGASECSPCGIGTFSASTGASACSPCAAGSVASGGAVECTVCASGFVDAMTRDLCVAEATADHLILIVAIASALAFTLICALIACMCPCCPSHAWCRDCVRARKFMCSCCCNMREGEDEKKLAVELSDARTSFGEGIRVAPEIVSNIAGRGAAYGTEK